MANPSLQIGNRKWAIKEDNLLGYSKAGTRFVPQPITMTRASAGTRVNSSGLVETVELLGSELVTNGDFATDSDWTKGANTTISSGTLNFSSASSNTDQSLTTTNSKIYKVIFIISNYVSGSVRFRFTGAANVNGTSRSTNGTFTQYITATANNSIFRFAASSFSGSIDNVSVKEVTKNNLARVDYDGTASSLLVEPERTNVNTYSEDFSQSFYIKDSGVSVGTTNNISPSGESNATKIDVTDNGRIYTNVASDTYTSSVFIKAGTFAYFKIVGVNIDLVAGTNANGTIDSLGSGWFRVGINYTGNRPFQIQAYPDGTYSSHTTTGDYYIWGSQIEAGSYATSYIPTDGSTVTRVQDQYEKTGISNLINSEEGVLFVEMAALANDGVFRIISLTDGGTTNRVSLIYNTSNNNIRVMVVSSAGGGMDTSNSVTSTLDFHKIAIKWKLNDFAVWIDGVEVATDTSGATPIGLDRIVFDVGNGSLDFYGEVKQLQVFKTALTDTELATLTT